MDENIALTSIHTLFVREHNRLARELKRINPRWDSETLYEETRKIMGAYTQVAKNAVTISKAAAVPSSAFSLKIKPLPPLQVFVFRDYLPHIVGDEAMRRQLGRYPGYDQNVDPSIANVFATAAYRFAHLAIQPVLSRLDANNREHPQFPSVPLFKAFFTPWRIVFEGGPRGEMCCNSSVSPSQSYLSNGSLHLLRWHRPSAAWFDHPPGQTEHPGSHVGDCAEGQVVPVCHAYIFGPGLAQHGEGTRTRSTWYNHPLRPPF